MEDLYEAIIYTKYGTEKLQNLDYLYNLSFLIVDTNNPVTQLEYNKYYIMHTLTCRESLFYYLVEDKLRCYIVYINKNYHSLSIESYIYSIKSLLTMFGVSEELYNIKYIKEDCFLVEHNFYSHLKPLTSMIISLAIRAIVEGSTKNNVIGCLDKLLRSYEYKFESLDFIKENNIISRFDSEIQRLIAIGELSKLQVNGYMGTYVLNIEDKYLAGSIRTSFSNIYKEIVYKIENGE